MPRKTRIQRERIEVTLPRKYVERLRGISEMQGRTVDRLIETALTALCGEDKLCWLRVGLPTDTYKQLLAIADKDGEDPEYVLDLFAGEAVESEWEKRTGRRTY